MSLLNIENISAGYGDSQVLGELSLQELAAIVTGDSKNRITFQVTSIDDGIFHVG